MNVEFHANEAESLLVERAQQALRMVEAHLWGGIGVNRWARGPLEHESVHRHFVAYVQPEGTLESVGHGETLLVARANALLNMPGNQRVHDYLRTFEAFSFEAWVDDKNVTHCSNLKALDFGDEINRTQDFEYRWNEVTKREATCGLTERVFWLSRGPAWFVKGTDIPVYAEFFLPERFCSAFGGEDILARREKGLPPRTLTLVLHELLGNGADPEWADAPEDLDLEEVIAAKFAKPWQETQNWEMAEECAF